MIQRYDTWPGGLASVGYASFHGGVFDGISIWLFPFDADAVMRVFVDNKTIVPYRKWPTDGFVKQAGSFTSGIFDGESIWMVPYHADRVVRLFTYSGSMVSYNNWPEGFSLGQGAFSGSAFDGISIWMVPSNADRVVRLFCANGTMVGYKNWPVGFSKRQSAFTGAYFDQERGLLWMLPCNADVMISLNVSDGTMKSYPSTSGDFLFGQAQFVGGVVDEKQSIWLVPHNSDRVVRVFTNNASMSDFPGWPAAFSKLPAAFGGGTFDGCSVWFAPSNVNQTVRIFTGNGSMQSYPIWPPGYVAPAHAFRGAIFDGSSVWFVPHTTKTLIEVRVPSFASCDAGAAGRRTATRSHVATLTATATVTKTLQSQETASSSISVHASQTSSLEPTATASKLIVHHRISHTTELSFTPTLGFSAVTASRTVTRASTLNESGIPINPFTQILGVTVARAVARSSVAAALVGSSLSPTLAVQAARPFVFLRSVNCKYQDETNNPDNDDPDSVELPLQVPLGSGAFSLYAGAMVVSFAVFVGIPTLSLAGLHFLIVRKHDCLPRWVTMLQRKVVSTAFFMTVGYFLPPTLKVFVLVVAHHGSTAAVLGASLCLAVAAALLAFLVEVIIRVVPKIEDLWALILSPTNHVAPKLVDGAAGEKSASEEITCRTFLASVESRHFLGTFGPLFCDARTLDRLPIRVYFLEDLLVSCALQALDGIRPSSEGPACSGVAGTMTLIIIFHLVYLVRFRPYREKVDLFLAVVGSFILLLSGVCACLTIFSTRESVSTVSLLLMGYLAVVESAYFYLQLIVVCFLEIARAHRRQLHTQWNDTIHISSPRREAGGNHHDEVDAESLQHLTVPLHVKGSENDVDMCRIGADSAYRNPLLERRSLDVI